VAKSFDWPTGAGWIVLNERGRTYAPLFAGPAVPARYASVTLTTAGPGLPISGMNEAGLAIEALVDGAVRASVTPEAARPTGLELVQQGLDRFATIGELASFAESRGVAQLAVPLHFFACDRSGACAVIESGPPSRGGRVHVTRGAEMRARVLANRPYASELTPHASQRFLTASRSLEASPAQTVDGAFHLLEKVRIPSLTKWQVVWELARGEAHFRDAAAPAMRTASVHLDPERRCAAAPQVRAIGEGAGDAAFHAWSAADAARAERSIRAQLGGSAAAAGLARLVATRTSSCAE